MNQSQVEKLLIDNAFSQIKSKSKFPVNQPTDSRSRLDQSNFVCQFFVPIQIEQNVFESKVNFYYDADFTTAFDLEDLDHGATCHFTSLANDEEGRFEIVDTQMDHEILKNDIKEMDNNELQSLYQDAILKSGLTSFEFELSPELKSAINEK